MLRTLQILCCVVTCVTSVPLLSNLTHPAGQIRCGDAKGASCSNAFNNIFCSSTGDSSGACCHDDFNGWCCPSGFTCAGVYNDPGGNNHCMTVHAVSNSCRCSETKYTIVEMIADGNMVVDKSYDDHLTACCESDHTDKCGWTSSITMSDEQQVSWSNSASIGVTVGFEAGVPGDLIKAGFEVKNTYTNGQTTKTSQSQTYSNQCTCTGTKCFSPWTKLTYALQYVTSHQKVTLKVRNCGVNSTVSGSVTVKKFEAQSVCDPGTHGFPSAKACENAHPAAAAAIISHSSDLPFAAEMAQEQKLPGN